MSSNQKILNQILIVFQEILTSNHTLANDRAVSYLDFVKNNVNHKKISR